MNQALDYGLILEKVHRVIEFIQEAWFKLYMRMNTELRAKVKNDFERDFFKLMNNSVFRISGSTKTSNIGQLIEKKVV